MKQITITVLAGSFQLFRPDTDSRGWRPRQHVKVCPRCLVAWARVDVEGEDAYSVQGQECPECPTLDPWVFGGPIPGSLLDDISSLTVDWDMLQFLPAPLIRREFELHLQAFTQTQEHHERTASYPSAASG